MAASGEMIGVTTVKINGIFRIDVKSARWGVKRAVAQDVTAAGIRTATGIEFPAGSFEEVIATPVPFNWRALRNFSVEIYDQATRQILIFGSTGCNWTGVDGSADLKAATASRSIPWVGTGVTFA